MKRFLADFLIVFGVLWLVDAPLWQEVVSATAIIVGLDLRDDS